MLFQYQQLAVPLVVEAPPPPAVPALSWQPRYPDAVPYRRVRLAPSSVAPFVEAPPPATPAWRPVYPDSVPHRRLLLTPSSVAPFVTAGAGPLRVSQLPVEAVFQYGSVLTRVSQLPVEAVWQYALTIRQTRVTQIAVEIVYPFGCHIFVPPLPAPCPVPNPDPDGGVHCTAPVLGGGS